MYFLNLGVKDSKLYSSFEEPIATELKPMSYDLQYILH